MPASLPFTRSPRRRRPRRADREDSEAKRPRRATDGTRPPSADRRETTARATKHPHRKRSGNARRHHRNASRNGRRENSDLTTAQTILLTDHLLIPYGVPKWEIGMVRLCAVTPCGSHLVSGVPLVHIRPSEQSSYRLADYAAAHALPSPAAALDRLQTYCDPRSPFESRFLDAYRQFVGTSDRDFAEALAPIPQAHLYVEDPLAAAVPAAVPGFMVKADFAFWTGKGFLVVEIDGESHLGSARHVTKDRALKAAGVEVVHILNEELERFGSDLILWLLPELAAF